MVRAGVFIGVDRCGDLQQLQDAAAGAKAMHEWALAQGMSDNTHAKLMTDAGGRKVHAQEVADEIEAICTGAGVDQLIVYFAGHGINLLHSDRWLLSDAQIKSYDAINVEGSILLARRCGIPHVVFIADACRVAPGDIQQATIGGIDVFPNSPGGDRAKFVDQFVACYLGRTAAEVKSSDERANYSALYTGVLMDALRGTRPEVLEPGGNGDAAMYIRPVRLEGYLEAEVPRRVKALKLERKVNQNPDAIITSRDAWVARIQGTAAANRAAAAGTPRPQPLPPPPPTLGTVWRALTASATDGRRDDVVHALSTAVGKGVRGTAQLADVWWQVLEPFGPKHFETQCGIKVRGARIDRVVAPLVQANLFDGELVQVVNISDGGAAATMLLVFANRTACLVPVIRGFLTALTFDRDELVDVACEPSDNTSRWNAYQERAEEVRTLRAVAAAASRYGRFRLNETDAEKVGRQMQQDKGIDPTLAAYAAYAYYDLQLVDSIREMSGYLLADVGVTLFDVELLAGRLAQRSPARDQPIVPFVPLLSQGWSLLRASQVTLHRELEGVERHLRNSLWTQFDVAAASQLERTLRSGDLR